MGRTSPKSGPPSKGLVMLPQGLTDVVSANKQMEATFTRMFLQSDDMWKVMIAEDSDLDMLNGPEEAKQE